MKRTSRLFSIIFLSFFLYSCPMASIHDTASAGGTVPAGTLAPTLQVDGARGQAVFVDQAGTRIDILAQEPDGSLVAATQGVGLAVIGDPPAGARAISGSDSDQPRAIVIGSRPDGSGGAWIVMTSGAVLPAAEDDRGRPTSLLPDSDARDHGMRAWLGWKYTVTGISSDGLMIVGNAVNAKGFRIGPVKVEPGTTVGVYWRLKRLPHHPHLRVAAARVIGTYDPPAKPPKRGHRGTWANALRLSRLPGLQLFFLNYFSSYLASAESVGGSAALYTVTGVDQDGDDATATIDPFDRIVVTPVTTTDQADLSVTAIQAATTPQTTSSTWTLGATVTNIGTADAGPTTLLYQLSTKSTLDGSATTIGTSTIPAVAAGSSYTDTFSTSFSIGQPGTHWVFVTADSANVVAESNESNNTASAAVPVIYGEIVIQTYQATSSAASNVDTVVSLFGSSGDTTVDLPNLWNNDLSPFSTETSAIAENGGRLVYGKIDYTGGLLPGTYYVRVRSPLSTHTGAYAIRVLTAPAAVDSTWQFGTTNPSDAPYEVDDNPLQGGVPTNPATLTIGLGGQLNRWLAAGNIASGTPGDVDWFKLVLP
jgi:hypothetical protein